METGIGSSGATALAESGNHPALAHTHFALAHVLRTIASIGNPAAMWSIERGNAQPRIFVMRGLCAAGVLVASAFAFMPGQLLYSGLCA